MGTDIHGWVEYQIPGLSPDDFMSCPVIRLGCLPSRDYDMFGSLFGVRNYALFKPIAAKRGIPIDVSYDVQQALREIADADPRMRDEFHSYTWITWKEIKNIDWEEEAEAFDNRAHVYTKDENGELIWQRKGLFGHEKLPDEAWKILRAGKPWEQGNNVYHLKKMKRKEALENEWEWQLLFDMMELLANRFGDEHVRMIVWFDG